MVDCSASRLLKLLFNLINNKYLLKMTINIKIVLTKILFMLKKNLMIILNKKIKIFKNI